MFTTVSLKFPLNKPKFWKFTRNLQGRQVQVQSKDILCSLIGRESCYFEEILYPKKSVWGRTSTFLMSAFHWGQQRESLYQMKYLAACKQITYISYCIWLVFKMWIPARFLKVNRYD